MTLSEVKIEKVLTILRCIKLENLSRIKYFKLIIAKSDFVNNQGLLITFLMFNFCIRKNCGLTK